MSTTAVAEARAAHDDRAAVEKAMTLLTCFGGQAGSGIGVSELARRAQLSKSTAYRLLVVLERNGVVEKVERKYRLGQRLHELGRDAYVAEHDWLRDSLTPYLVDLYESTHETVHLGALHGTDVVYLSKLYGHRQVRSPPGSAAGSPRTARLSARPCSPTTPWRSSVCWQANCAG
jgi:DNA-binding IclR family transcriptional regulator